MTPVPTTTVTTIRDLARALSRAVQDNPSTIQCTSIASLDRITTHSGSIYDGLNMTRTENSSVTFHPDRTDLLTQALDLLLSSMLPTTPSPTLQIRAQYLPYSHILSVVFGEPS